MLVKLYELNTMDDNAVLLITGSSLMVMLLPIWMVMHMKRRGYPMLVFNMVMFSGMLCGMGVLVIIIALAQDVFSLVFLYVVVLLLLLGMLRFSLMIPLEIIDSIDRECQTDVMMKPVYSNPIIIN